MSAQRKFTAQEMIDAIHATDGIVRYAAKRLGCTRQTVYRYIRNYTTVKDALDEARENTIDYVEAKLIEQIKNGNLTAIIFYLKTQGRGRGYNERIDIHMNVKLINEVTQALEAIGEDPEAVFRRLIETAKRRADADG